MSSNAERMCKVGYALNKKKLRKSSFDKKERVKANDTAVACAPIKSPAEWRGGGLADILDNSDDTGNIEFIEWNPEVPLNDQPHFDVIIHKLTEDIDNIKSTDKMNALSDYLTLHPQTKIVDSVSDVRKVISRAMTCKHLQSIQKRLGNSCPFTQPNFIIVNERDKLTANDILNLVSTNGLSFPIICKPVEACGTANSHLMVVIVSPEDIHLMLKLKSCVVQQYYNHDANFYKVYVIDTDVMVFKRSSLPNLNVISCNTHAPISCKRPLNALTISEPMAPLRKKTTVEGDESSSENSTVCVSGALRLFRSVSFDSRVEYPTLESFLINTQHAQTTTTASAIEQPPNGMVSVVSTTETAVPFVVDTSLQPPVNGLDIITDNDSSSWKVASPLKRSTKSNRLCKYKNCISTTSVQTPLAPSDVPAETNAYSVHVVAVAAEEEASHVPNGVYRGDYESKTGCAQPNGINGTVGASPQQTFRTTSIATVPPPAQLCCSQSTESLDEAATKAALEKEKRDIEANMPDFRAAAEEIKKEFGLSLFGFDVIIPIGNSSLVDSGSILTFPNRVESNGQGSYDESGPGQCQESGNQMQHQLQQHQKYTQQQQQIVVIDVNYFPSYKEVVDFPQKLKKYLRKTAFGEEN